jgi:DNA polymerase III epsilon subunit-like protein
MDFETGSLNTETCQITQICALMLNPRTLRVEPNGIFNSEVQPVWEEEKAIAAGWAPVDQKALDVTRKTREKLNEAPPFKIVWEKYLQFHKKFNPTRSAYKAPIMVGYNIIGFDMPITERLCQKFGPTYKDRGALFNPIHRYDVFDMFEGYTENNPNIQGMKLSDCAKWMGIKVADDSLHDALTDVKICANIFVKLLHLQREVAKQTDFTRAYKDKELLI